MTAGHFGFAAAVKPMAPRVPLWALMLATYLLDVFFIFLASAGIESFSQIDPGHPTYGGALIHAYYSHSLVGAAIVAIIAGAVVWRVWGRTASLLIGGVVFSHWLLDLIVHRPDLPILPGHVAGLPLLGLGLWNYPVISAATELVLAVGGALLYYRAANKAPAASKSDFGVADRAIVASGVVGALVVLLLAADVLGLSLLLAIGLMLLIVVVGGWLDGRLGWRQHA